jgi:hypothetical protein
MLTAREDLRLSHLSVVHVGTRSGDLGPGVRAIAFDRLLDDLERLG